MPWKCKTGQCRLAWSAPGAGKGQIWVFTAAQRAGRNRFSVGVFLLVFFFPQDIVIADNKHSDGGGDLPPAIDGYQPSRFGPVTLLQQHMGTKHPTRECCRRQEGTWAVGSALSPARSTQGDEPEEEELGNLEERGGREEQTCPFSWHISGC